LSDETKLGLLERNHWFQKEHDLFEKDYFVETPLE